MHEQIIQKESILGSYLRIFADLRFFSSHFYSTEYGQDSFGLSNEIYRKITEQSLYLLSQVVAYIDSLPQEPNPALSQLKESISATVESGMTLEDLFRDRNTGPFLSPSQILLLASDIMWAGSGNHDRGFGSNGIYTLNLKLNTSLDVTAPEKTSTVCQTFNNTFRAIVMLLSAFGNSDFNRDFLFLRQGAYVFSNGYDYGNMNETLGLPVVSHSFVAMVRRDSGSLFALLDPYWLESRLRSNLFDGKSALKKEDSKLVPSPLNVTEYRAVDYYLELLEDQNSEVRKLGLAKLDSILHQGMSLNRVEAAIALLSRKGPLYAISNTEDKMNRYVAMLKDGEIERVLSLLTEEGYIEEDIAPRLRKILEDGREKDNRKFLRRIISRTQRTIIDQSVLRELDKVVEGVLESISSGGQIQDVIAIVYMAIHYLTIREWYIPGVQRSPHSLYKMFERILNQQSNIKTLLREKINRNVYTQRQRDAIETRRSDWGKLINRILTIQL